MPAGSNGLSDPQSKSWKSVDAQAVSLAPVPLDAQPTEYVRVAWTDRAYGTVKEASLAVAREGDQTFVRLEWADPSAEAGEFPDAAAVYFPADADAGSPATIGDAQHPVDVWLWQANRENALRLSATGPGAFRKQAGDGVQASALLENGRWAVVFAGPSASDRVGVVVYDGSNEERAGIGSATAQWVGIGGDSKRRS